MNKTYSVGDRVELIEHYDDYQAGTQATVTSSSAGRENYTEWEDDKGRKYGCFAHRLKLVTPELHEYKVGDRVQITIPEGDASAYGGAFFKTGTGTVRGLQSREELLLVAGEASQDGNEWYVDKKFVTPLVEEVREPRVGDTIISKRVWGESVAVGTRCIVTHLLGEGALQARVEGSTDMFPWYFAKGEYELEPRTEKPQATPVTKDTKPAVGDTIVAFWELNGVEYRQKGVVARIDKDGTLETAEGNHINVASAGHSRSYSGHSESVFIVERATTPEPVKVGPNQKWIDAPIGSIARDAASNFVWRKTADNVWSLLTTYGDIVRDCNDSTVGISAVLFTP